MGPESHNSYKQTHSLIRIHKHFVAQLTINHLYLGAQLKQSFLVCCSVLCVCECTHRDNLLAFTGSPLHSKDQRIQHFIPMTEDCSHFTKLTGQLLCCALSPFQTSSFVVIPSKGPYWTKCKQMLCLQIKKIGYISEQHLAVVMNSHELIN